MKIIVDVMGGDKAPLETVKGAIAALREWNDLELILVGNRAEIEKIAGEEGFDLSSVEIVHTDGVITMEDDPMCVTRAKKDSSMALGLRMLADGRGDAFVSTGNTGALFTGGTLIVRKVKGVQRAGIGTVMPFQTPVLLLDSGANVTVVPENLEQFAMIGSVYMKKMFEIERPRVGLLNNGSEACKGTEVQQTAYKLLSEQKDVHFVGNIEGSVLPFDCCDVIVTDGFLGNIMLKSSEGVLKLMLKKLKAMFKGPTGILAYLLLKSKLRGLKKQFDPAEIGGAPILGLSKPVIKAHGSSDAKAFKNAIRQAADYAASGALDEIAAAAAAWSARKKAEKQAADSANEAT